MSKKWLLRLEDNTNSKESLELRLVLQETKSDKFIHLAGPCETFDDFHKEISHLIDELNQVSAEAREKAKSLEQQGGAGQKIDVGSTWKQMEACGTEAEMFELFNSYDEEQRQEVAEYVLTQVNMFKGRGPVFSEHYDSATHLLE